MLVVGVGGTPAAPMSNPTFGLTMLVVGMGGTLATLFLITLCIRALSVFFPVRSEHHKEEKK